MGPPSRRWSRGGGSGSLPLPLPLLLLVGCGLAGLQGAAATSAAGRNLRGQVVEAHQLVENARNGLAEVIELLASMLHEFDRQAEEDRVNWEDYSKWSGDTETEKRNFIQEQQALVMSTEATLNANKQQVQQLTQDLTDLEGEVHEEQQSLNELTAMRHEEHQQFQASLTDVTKTIDAVTQAMTILAGHYGAAAPAALAEIRSRVQVALTMFAQRTPTATQQNVQKLSSMLQTGNPDFLNADASKYENYGKQGGGGVINMLEDLKGQLESQRNDLIATESASQREYETTKAAKDANLAGMRHTHDEKTAKKAGCEATIQQCLSTMDQAKHEIGESQAYVKQMLEDRALFEKQFNERTTMRTQERGATQAALDALQSVSAGAKEHVESVTPGLLQSSLSFLQLQSKLSEKAGTRLNGALSNLVRLGQEMTQPVLAQLAEQMRQDFMTEQREGTFDQGKFGPVLKLLNDLITRLEEEAAAETSQHQWCETEKETSEAAKEEREKIVHQLMATIEALTTNIANLKSEVEFLESEIARVTEETRVAKEIRVKEHELYVASKADHEEVISAIEQALSALGGSFGLLQVGEGGSPFSATTTGAGAASAQEMLQDLLSRYSEALRTIITDEAAAVKAHEELLIRNAQFISDCTNSKNAKTAERRGLINQLHNDKAEIKTNMIELHETGQYLMDLRPSCDDIRSTFEERTKRREAEIAALKEALQVISDPTAMA